MTNHYEEFTSRTDRRRILALHWITVPLVIAIVGVGAYRTWGLQSAFMNRMDIVVITAGAKSLVFLAYILLTEYIESFKGAHSTLTVFIMSIIDSLLWPAALGLTAYGMVQIPSTGTRNILNWILIVLLAVAFLISLPTLWLSYRLHKQTKASRRQGAIRPAEGHYSAGVYKA